MKRMDPPKKQARPPRTFMSISWRNEHLGMKGTGKTFPLRQYDKTLLEPMMDTQKLVEFVRGGRNRLQRQEAVIMLSSREGAGVDECLEWVLERSNDEFLRAEAVRAAGWRYRPASWTIICKGLGDPDSYVREEAGKYAWIWSSSGILEPVEKNGARKKEMGIRAKEDIPVSHEKQPAPARDSKDAEFGKDDSVFRRRSRPPRKPAVA